jgi:hypothetical protein
MHASVTSIQQQNVELQKVMYYDDVGFLFLKQYKKQSLKLNSTSQLSKII